VFLVWRNVDHRRRIEFHRNDDGFHGKQINDCFLFVCWNIDVYTIGSRFCLLQWVLVAQWEWYDLIVLQQLIAILTFFCDLDAGCKQSSCGGGKHLSFIGSRRKKKKHRSYHIFIYYY
jgi:hypothetical protein